MKICVDCGSNEIVKNLNSNKIYCFDCKSERVFRNCYECHKIIKEEPFDGSDGWHDDVKWIKYSQYADKLVTCWQNHKINEAINEDCS